MASSQTVSDVINVKTANAVERVGGLVEKSGVDSTLVKPVTELVTAIATTVVNEGVKKVSDKLGLTLISESNLTDQQKLIAKNIYASVKDFAKEFIADPTLNNTLKVTKVIAQIVKQVENVRVDGKPPTGADKKAVVLQLGRILIRELTPDDKGEAEILLIYDLTADKTLETLIEVSRVVNVKVQELANKCCVGFFDLFKRSSA